MAHHKFKTEKTAHVFTHGEPSEKTEYLWFVTHGYGQLASSIIRKFEGFDPTTHFVVAPEALNRFYWQFKSSVVGASWMTRQDRLDEIADYTTYLDTVFAHFKMQVPPSVKIILFGFSQGCATQMRWILRGAPNFDHLVFWGGVLPEDLDYQPFLTYFSDKKITFVCGDTDEFINQEGIEKHLALAKEKNLAMDFIGFEGKHEILTDVLMQVFKDKIKGNAHQRS
jgi:predicted esterase